MDQSGTGWAGQWARPSLSTLHPASSPTGYTGRTTMCAVCVYLCACCTMSVCVCLYVRPRVFACGRMEDLFCSAVLSRRVQRVRALSLDSYR